LLDVDSYQGASMTIWVLIWTL